MVVAFFHDGPMYCDNDGNYHNGILNDDIIDRYFYLADEFISVTRIYLINAFSEGTTVSHNNVKFVGVPNLNSLKGRIFDRRKCRNIIKEQVRLSDYVIARVPSYVASIAIFYAKKFDKPFLTEVVGCPWDSLWNYNWKGKILAPRAYFSLRKIMKHVPYAIYVTNRFLQNRYPTKGISESCSNVQIVEPNISVLNNRLNRIRKNKEIIVIGTTAAVDVKYKGQQFVIEALGKLKKKGFTNFRYELVGGGNQCYLRNVAEKNDVADQVLFKGGLSHSDVLNWLDTIDIYAQPSRQEGLPRSLIEAMSRGLPCFGAKTGGIPELLDSKYITRNNKKCVDDICNVILSFDTYEMVNCAKRNFNEAKNYYIDIIKEKRFKMFELLKAEKSKKR